MNRWALVGLAVMIVTETATLAGIEPFASWNTPIAWTGFIIFADASVWRARGRSWIRSAPREFAFLALVSIPLWLVFEFYNRFIDNWYYVGLPENTLLRYFGYAWSFATIWPAIFEGAELIAGAARPSRPSRLLPSCPSRPSCPSCPSRPLPPPFPIIARRSDARMAAVLAVAVPRGAGLARVHLPARSDQRAPRRGVAVFGFPSRRRLTLHEPDRERIPVRHPVGVLELLVARQVALHGAHHGAREDLRDAAARVTSAFRRSRSNASRCMSLSAP